MAVYVAYAPVRRARLARDLLHDRDGALAHERDGHRVGAHALARDAAGGVGGVEAGPGQRAQHTCLACQTR
jgi:hypothetical protein